MKNMKFTLLSTAVLALTGCGTSTTTHPKAADKEDQWSKLDTRNRDTEDTPRVDRPQQLSPLSKTNRARVGRRETGRYLDLGDSRHPKWNEKLYAAAKERSKDMAKSGSAVPRRTFCAHRLGETA